MAGRIPNRVGREAPWSDMLCDATGRLIDADRDDPLVQPDRVLQLAQARLRPQRVRADHEEQRVRAPMAFWAEVRHRPDGSIPAVSTHTSRPPETSATRSRCTNLASSCA